MNKLRGHIEQEPAAPAAAAQVAGQVGVGPEIHFHLMPRLVQIHLTGQKIAAKKAYLTGVGSLFKS